jgi:hypothetical protein
MPKGYNESVGILIIDAFGIEAADIGELTA